VTKNNPHEISIAQPALKAHLGHGDTLGPCPTQTPGATPAETPTKKGGKKK